MSIVLICFQPLLYGECCGNGYKKCTVVLARNLERKLRCPPLTNRHWSEQVKVDPLCTKAYLGAKMAATTEILYAVRSL